MFTSPFRALVSPVQAWSSRRCREPLALVVLVGATLVSYPSFAVTTADLYGIWDGTWFVDDMQFGGKPFLAVPYPEARVRFDVHEFDAATETFGTVWIEGAMSGVISEIGADGSNVSMSISYPEIGAVNLGHITGAMVGSTISGDFDEDPFRLVITWKGPLQLTYTGARGSDPTAPVMPDWAGEGVFDFTALCTPCWYDPPAANGFSYALGGGGAFLEVGAPPAAFGFSPVQVVVSGDTVATLDPGARYTFAQGVSAFEIRGIAPTVDGSDPAAFPTLLSFTGSPASLRMTAIPVPEPGTTAMFGAGLVALLVGGLHRRHLKGQRARTRLD